MTGTIHSIETFGTLDGPGIRTVVFMQGCPNKCKFCHNPDCAMKKNGGTPYTVDELVEEVLKNKAYWNTYAADEDKKIVKGGVTFSGGDPLMQPEFLLEVTQNLKKSKVHVVVDTSVNADFDHIKKLVPFVNLWMISIKYMDDTVHKDLVGVSNKNILENILALDKIRNTKIRIRFVVIPGITDSPEHINQLGAFIKKIKHLEKVELLPYSTIGRQKWIELFGEYHLDGVPEATPKDVENVKTILQKYLNKF